MESFLILALLCAEHARLRGLDQARLQPLTSAPFAEIFGLKGLIAIAP
jgi:hypothetical protein